jgi:hypothetical protein
MPTDDLTERTIAGYAIMDGTTRQLLRSLAQAADSGALDSEPARDGAAALALALLEDASARAIPDRHLSHDAWRESSRVVDAFLSTIEG